LRLWIIKSFLSTAERKRASIGVLGVILAMICGMAIFASAVPWRGTTDAPQHLDYAWQLGHGNLPDFWQGTQAPLGRPKSKIQFVSHHPPLYYAILAPFVTPLLDDGHWVRATAIARVISIIIGVLCVLAMAWGGWVIGGKRRALFAVAVPAIGSSLLAFYVAAEIMNDGLMMLFATLALVLSIRTVQSGIKTSYTAWLAVVCLGGMATKASFFGTVLVVFVTLFIAAWLHTKGTWLQKLLPAIKASAIITIVIAIGIGWFYVHNYQLSGSPFRNRPPGSAQNILPGKYETLPEVLTSPETWKMLTTGLYGRSWKILPRVGNQAINFWPSLLIILTVTYGAVAQIWKSRKKLTVIMWAIIGLLLLQFIITYGQQIAYSVGYGGVNRRYLLPAWLSFAGFMAVGALYFKKLRGQGVLLIVVLGWLSIMTSATSILVRQFKVVMTNPIQALYTGITEKNDIPGLLLPVLIIGLVAGLTTQAIIMWRLTAKKS